MKTLIMLPGMMCDERLFKPQITHLNGRYDIRVLPIHEHETIKDLAEDVLENAPSEFALMGLSMGGIVAMEIIKQASEQVTHLALLDTNPRAELEEVKRRREPQIEKVKNGGLVSVMRDEMKPKYLVDSDKKPAILDLCMDMAKGLGETAFINQSLALRDRSDYQDTISQYTSPTLILCGRKDLLCPPERHELMHNLIECSQLKIIDGAGHLPTLEQSDLVNKALDEWLLEKKK